MVSEISLSRVAGWLSRTRTRDGERYVCAREGTNLEGLGGRDRLAAPADRVGGLHCQLVAHRKRGRRVRERVRESASAEAGKERRDDAAAGGRDKIRRSSSNSSNRLTRKSCRRFALLLCWRWRSREQALLLAPCVLLLVCDRGEIWLRRCSGASEKTGFR